MDQKKTYQKIKESAIQEFPALIPGNYIINDDPEFYPDITPIKANQWAVSLNGIYELLSSKAEKNDPLFEDIEEGIGTTFCKLISDLAYSAGLTEELPRE